MKWASAISKEPSLRNAVEHCARQVASQLGEEAPDILLAFVSSSHRDEYD